MNKLMDLFFQRRSLEPENIRDMISTGTLALPCLDEMCGKLHQIKENGDRIALFTDFDMDGIMSGVVGYAGLCELGFLVTLAPSDPRNGYGMHESDVDRILTDHPDTKVILTGDVGIAENESIDYAVSKGLTVLVTDHHQMVNSLPAVACCVDPVLANDGTGRYFTDICGAHVMYLVLRRYAELYCDTYMAKQIDRLRVFAGIATVADSMPVYHENRGIIMDAVAITRMLWANGDQEVVNLIPGCDVYRRAMLGMYVICEVFRENRKLADAESIDETFFGYYLIPVFNSLKRMDQDLTLAYDVFFGGRERSEACVRVLLDLNDERKKSVADALAAMMDDPQPYAPYIYMTQAPAGFRGLLAQQAMAVSNVPTLVIGQKPDGRWGGSGRSQEWFQLLDECAGLEGCRMSGHQQALGVVFTDLDAVERVKDFLDGRVQEIMKSGGVKARPADLYISMVNPDADTDVDMDLFMDFLREMDMYRPFGPGFTAPDFELEFRAKDARWFRFGSEGQHVKAVLPMGFSVMMFNKAPLFRWASDWELDMDCLGEIVKYRGTLTLNRYMGNESVQFLCRR